MAITINNISFLTVQRQLDRSCAGLSKAYEKLSSGMRINRPSDDAAGLAISSTLDASVKVLAQANRNVNDGISVLAIADSTINELTTINTRIAELAEQAANGPYTNKQREAMDKEAQALATEYFRIARSTTFNGMNLFDGSVQGLSLQAGSGADTTLQSSLGGKMGSGSFAAVTDFATTLSPSALTLGDVNNDGFLDMLSVGSTNSTLYLGNGDGTFRPKTDIAMSLACAGTLGDVNNDGLLDLTVGTLTGQINVQLGNGDGTFKAARTYANGGLPQEVCLADLNSDGSLDIISGNSGTPSVSIFLGNGDGTFKPRADLSVASAARVQVGDLNNDNALDVIASGSTGLSIFLGNGDGSFKNKTDITTGTSLTNIGVADFNKDSFMDIAVNDATNRAIGVLLGNGDGTFQSKKDYAAAPTIPNGLDIGDWNADGELDLAVGNTNAVSVILGNGDGTFASKTDFATGHTETKVKTGDLNGDGALDLVTVGSAANCISVLLAVTRDGVGPIVPFSLRSRAEALQALGPLKQNLDRLSTQRGVIGAFQSRLSSANAVLTSAIENYRSAGSRITDADIAEESAALVRLQIAQQAGTAVAAQANQQPKIVLNLLSNL